MRAEQDITEAIKVLKRITARKGKRGVRIHQGSAEDAGQRIRALEGLCGDCSNLTTEFTFFDGKPRVMLRCAAMNSPIELFRRTPFGQEAQCKDFRPRE